MYRTGDLARWPRRRAAGVPRPRDDQVKLRGFRIEPGEIEAVLAGAPRGRAGRRGCVREDRPGERRLVAYVVPRDGEHDPDPDAAARRTPPACCPTYMVPAAFVALDALPLTPQRQARPGGAARAGARRRRRHRAAPRRAREETLCALFAEVLGVARGRCRRRLLRARRRQHHRDPAGRAGPAPRAWLTPRDVFTRARRPRLAAAARDTGDRSRRVRRRTPVRGGSRSPRSCTGGANRPATRTRSPVDAAAGAAGRRGRDARRRRPAGAARPARRAADAAGRHAPDDWSLEVPSPPAAAVRAADAAPGRRRRRRRRAGAGRGAAAPAPARTRATGRMLRPRLARRGVRAAGAAAAGRAPPGRRRGVLADPAVADLAGPGWPGRGRPDRNTAGTSFRRWARAAGAEAGRPEPADELAPGGSTRWPARTRGSRPAGDPERRPPRGDAHRRRCRAERHRGRCSPTVPAAFHCGADDVLLTGRWPRRRSATWRGDAAPALLVDLEGHGREELVRGVDLVPHGRLVHQPVPGAAGPGRRARRGFWHGGAATGSALKRVKEQLRAVPGDGIGYGLLRHLNPDTAPSSAALPVPDLRLQLPGPVRRRPRPTAELLGAAPAEALPLAARAWNVDAVVVGEDARTARGSAPAGRTPAARCSARTTCASWPALVRGARRAGRTRQPGGRAAHQLRLPAGRPDAGSDPRDLTLDLDDED